MVSIVMGVLLAPAEVRPGKPLSVSEVDSFVKKGDGRIDDGWGARDRAGDFGSAGILPCVRNDTFGTKKADTFQNQISLGLLRGLLGSQI
jgi:hypothetical protein